jgi:probable rRNA maturation factor
MVTAATRLRVSVSDGRGRPLRRPALTRWLVALAPASASGQLAIALVCDAKMRILNRDFRGVDRPTDVLSFPTDPSPHPMERANRFLGDVVIATGVAQRQARRLGHGLQLELRRLALHGLLHVLGYDHEIDDGRMERFERRLLRKGGIEVSAG